MKVSDTDSVGIAIGRSILFWIAFVTLLLASGFVSGSFLPPELSRWGYGILGSLSALLVTLIFLKVQKQSFRDIGLVWESKSLFRFFIGGAIGLLIFGLIVLILTVFSDVSFELNPVPFRFEMVAPYLVFIPLAFMEEIGFRAYSLVKLNKSVGLLATQFIVAIAFALYHLSYGWSVEAAFLGTFVWAWVFGLAAVWSGGIALPTGLHVSVNVLQGLTGMKEGDSIWVIVKEPTSENSLAESTVGLVIHGLILLTAVGLTILYIRNSRR